MDRRLDILCVGMALVDSLIRGFDPKPVSASRNAVLPGLVSEKEKRLSKYMFLFCNFRPPA